MTTEQPAVSQAVSTAAPAKIDSGDTAWLLVSSALVLLMTAPGLALFYGGMVRQKNALATIMQSFIIMALISVQWMLWGYSLAFGPDNAGLIGGLGHQQAPRLWSRTDAAAQFAFHGDGGDLPRAMT